MSGQFDGIDGSIRPAYPTAAIVPAGLPLLKPHPEVLRTAARPSDPLPANIGSRSRVASAVGPDIANPIAAQMPSGRWHIADPGIGDASPVNGPVRTEIGSVRIAQAEPALNPRAGVRGSGPAVGPGDLPGQSVGPGTPESRSSVASIGPDGYMLFSPSTTPWARLARVGEQLAAAQPGIGRPTTTHPASGPPRVKTPWSKIERPIAAAKVFAPVQRGPASRPRREQEAVETNRDLDSGHSLPTPDTVTLSTAQALEAPHRER